MPRREIDSSSQIEELRAAVTAAAGWAIPALVKRLSRMEPLDALGVLKFDEVGLHPIEHSPLNLVEQVNQTFTYLASLAAADRVLRMHSGSSPISLNLGTSPGYDLESASASVVGEVFAAVRRTNNRKLVKDVAKVAREEARHKYVFFYCPDHPGEAFSLELFPDVQVIPLTQAEVWGRQQDGA